MKTDHQDDDNPLLLTSIGHDKLRVGQRWSYRARPVDPESTLVIVAIDRHCSGTLVNIAIQNLNAGPDLKELLVPITLEHLEGELIDLLDDGVDVANHSGSYTDWKALVEKGKAGTFTTSPAAIVETIAAQ